MEQEEVDRLRKIFRSFKRSASRLRGGYKEITEAGSISFRMRGEEGKNIEASFDEWNSLVRFSALLRPFIAKKSPLEIDSVWRDILEGSPIVDGANRVLINDLFSQAEMLDIPIVLNGKALSARDLYFAYAEGNLFDEQLEAKKLLDQLSVEPMKQMVQFLFYGICLNYSKIVVALLDLILDIERKNPELAIQHKNDPQCIYCLSRDGDFKSEEHVIPEAFGMDEIVLQDSVCCTCNNEFSKLDQFLAEFGPLSFLRVLYVPLTKKGKFPSAKIGDLNIRKTKPRKIIMSSNQDNNAFKISNQVESLGPIDFDLSFSSKLDVLRLARSVFKIGLGLVAFDYGTEYACGTRFDSARNFIREEGLMPSHILVLAKSTPCPLINTYCQSNKIATFVGLDIFGCKFIINLDSGPCDIPVEIPSELFLQIWLGSESSKGKYSPCPKGCKHS